MSNIAKNIIIDITGKTLGATVIINGKEYKYKTEDLKIIRDTVKFDNAIIDINGYVRSKSGNLNKEIYKTRPNAIEQSEISKAQKLKSMNPMTLYHGNKDKDMIPKYGAGKKENDYGQGLYTTPDEELGKEWAYSTYSKGDQGYIHKYALNIEGLKILDLTEKHSLHWIAELVYNRTINTEGKEALQDTIDDFISQYKLDTSGYDIIIGYRADDSYFTYAIDFVSGSIYLDTVEKALRNGDLGLQVFIKSKKAFAQLGNAVSIEPVDISYSRKYRTRDLNARERYKQIKKNDNAMPRRDRKKITDFI